MQPIRRKLEPGIFERVTPDGRRLGLEIQYKDADARPRRRSVAGDIHAARNALAEARVRRVRHELEPNDPRVTFNQVADQFDASHVAGLRPNSRQTHRTALARLRRVFGDKRMSTISKADVRRFVADERAEGLKANTIINHLSTLRAVYTFARDDLDMPVTMPKLKASERPQAADDAREHRILTDGELAALLDACRPDVRLYFRLLAETGARASEGLGLTPRRVGPGEISFTDQLARGGGLAPLKTRQSRRTIEITRSLAAELRLQAGRDLVFEHLTHRQIEREWDAARKRAIVAEPQPVVHDLRHTHVSRLIAAGWDPVEVAARIGDTLQTTLRVYSHEFDQARRGQERRDALERLYGMATEMATDRPSQAVTDGAKVQRLPTRRNTA